MEPDKYVENRFNHVATRIAFRYGIYNLTREEFSDMNRRFRIKDVEHPVRDERDQVEAWVKVRGKMVCAKYDPSKLLVMTVIPAKDAPDTTTTPQEDNDDNELLEFLEDFGLPVSGGFNQSPKQQRHRIRVLKSSFTALKKSLANLKIEHNRVLENESVASDISNKLIEALEQKNVELQVENAELRTALKHVEKTMTRNIKESTRNLITNSKLDTLENITNVLRDVVKLIDLM